MNNLAEDLEEVGDDAAGRRFVRHWRRNAGLEPHEPSCWFAHVEQKGPVDDRHMVSIGRSPGDVIFDAELIVAGRYGGGYRRLGLGTWMLEVEGAGCGIEPVYLRVRAALDEAQ